MSVKYDKLEELQKVLAQMFEIEDRIKDIPKNLNDKEAVLQKTKIDYLETHNKCDAIRAEVDEIFAKYTEAGKTKEDKEKQMETTTLSRECENLLKEIEEAKTSEQTLLKNYNAKKKYLSEIEIRLQAIADIMAAQTEEVEEERTKKDALVAEQETILNEMRKQKEALSEGMPESLIFKFERIIRNKNGVGVVPVHGIICQGCHMELPQQFANDVRKATLEGSDEIHFCPYCSRILFYEESEEDNKLSNQVYGDVVADAEEESESDEGFISSEENLFED